MSAYGATGKSILFILSKVWVPYVWMVGVVSNGKLLYWSGNCYTSGTCAIPYSFSTTCVKRSVHGKVSPLVYYYLPGTWSLGGSSIYASLVPRSSVRKGLGTRLHIHQPLCSVAILYILALGRLLAGNLMYTNVVQQLSSHPLMATYSEDGELCTN